MKIAVLGGSPKGETSVTMQYVEYLKRMFPEHEMTVLQAAQPIVRLETNGRAFDELIERVRGSDGVLWAFPLYVFLVSAQYKRFIELIFERGAADAFKGAYAASLSTSIHFFDHTAHSYIRAVSEDLGMRFAGSHSAGMRDLLDADGRERLLRFARCFFDTMREKIEIPRLYEPIEPRRFRYAPGARDLRALSPAGKTVVVADTLEGNTGRMVDAFRSQFRRPPDLVDLSSLDMKGGCLGCLRCGADNRCVYEGKDGFIDMYRERLMTADILVFAGEVRDRFLSSRWKLFLDRSFFNTHQRSLEGKQFGFLICGPLGRAADLREILSAYVEWQGSSVVDFVCDDVGDSVRLDRAIEGLARRLVLGSEARYLRPATFLGVGGMKIFRDDLWGGLKVVFRADHKKYRKTGVYDFPHRKPLANLLMAVLYALTGIPRVRRAMEGRMREFMIAPYRRVLERSIDLPHPPVPHGEILLAGDRNAS